MTNTTITPGVGALSLTGGMLVPQYYGAASFLLPLRTLVAGSTGLSGTAAFTLPLRTLVVDANNGASFGTPLRTLVASGLTGVFANLATNLPLRTLVAAGVIDVYANASFQTLLRSLSSQGITGSIADADFILPRRSLLSMAPSGVIADASFDLLLRTLSGNAYPEMVADASFCLPLRYIDAAGFPSILEHYRAWVMNARTGALVEYGNFDFNSLASFSGRYLAAGPNGLYLLGGDLDDMDDIDAVLRTGLNDYGSSFLKRIPRVYLSGDQEGDIYFSTISTEDGKRTYALNDNTMPGEQMRRVPIGRGPKSVRWQFEIANKNGSKFGVSKIIVYPQNLRRRAQ